METENKFACITNSIKDAIILVDEEAKISYWNPAAEKTFGYANKEAIGKCIHELVVPKSMCPEGRSRIKQSVNIFAETGVGYFTVGNVELIGRHKNGKEFPVELSISPLKISGKWSAVGVVKDLSEKKQAEHKKKETEQRYHAMFNQSPLGILIVDPQTMGFVEFNDVAHQQLGYTREEFEKLTVPDIEARESPEEVRSHMDAMLKVMGEEFETEQQTKDCSIRNILVSTRTIMVRDKKFLHCIFHDITEIRNVQKSLVESEAQYRQLVEVAQEGVWVFDADYVTKFVNPRMAQMFGYVQSELVGKKIFDFIDEETLRMFQDYMKEHKEGIVGNFEYEFSKKDGTRVFTSISASQITDDNGNYIGTMALLADITTRKDMEKKLEKYSKHLESLVEKKTNQLAEAQAQIIKSERLAAIGELAGMIGHDLRNPLSGIKNAAYYLRKRDIENLSPQSKEMIEIIDKCVGHSNKIINDLLDYSREIRLDREKTTIDDLVSEALSMVRIPEKVNVEKKFEKKAELVVDLDKLERVFVNLVKNAIDAMPDGGTILIAGKETNGHLELAFTDTGIGIPDDVMPKIFSPLFTTKAQGMGFGLAICKRVVEAHGGTINCQTVKGKGTTFTVTLPLDSKSELEVKQIG
jgi:PAS domain S-box-containing protein